MLDSLLARHKPDILDCIANLSSDEVFTPPALANKMLDLLPPEVWTDPTLRFLDPGCKSGVFLREAAKRLMVGLAEVMPREEVRREHIFKHMLHGIAITELTAQISRRTLYYSKDASSEHSVVAMPTADGNIRYKNIAHTFKVKGGPCTHCGAPEDAGRDLETFESHAYLFIHENFDPTMKFDVIIGNPPYQLKDGEGGNGTSATPIYQYFIERAMAMQPRFVSMIVPSRWFAGGKGLDSFRERMLKRGGFRKLVDYADASECFPGVQIKGGVNYFLWEQSHKGLCEVVNVLNGEPDVGVLRDLTAHDVFVRFNKAESILNKIANAKESTFNQLVSSSKPFGLRSNFPDYEKTKKDGYLRLFIRTNEIGWVSESKIKAGTELIKQHKVFLPKAGPGNDGFPHQITGKPVIGAPADCCTETYLVCTGVASEQEAINMRTYMESRFFRFLVALRKPTHNTSKDCFAFVPVQDFSRVWTDEMLYEKYEITPDEATFIASVVKEMA